MNIEVSLKWLNPNYLLNADASLSLGWIELTVDNKRFNLFKKQLCMLYITMADLIEFLSEDRNSFNWIGADSSESYFLERKNSLLFINYNKSYIKLDCLLFKIKIILCTYNLIEYNRQTNNKIEKESAFIDLVNCLDKLEEKLK